MGSISDRVVDNFGGDGLSIYAVLGLLLITGLLANAYAEYVRRRRIRETHGMDDLLPY